MSYDIKFRQAAINRVLEGKKQTKVKKMFGISMTTLQNWLKIYKETGNLKSRKRKITVRKICSEELKKYVEAHPYAYLKEIAEVFNCSDEGIRLALKKLGFTRKKKIGRAHD